MNSDTYLQQINAMGPEPDFHQQIAKAYEEPVLKPLVNERADLESQYLPSIFQPFQSWGTGAADLSPTSKLNMIGSTIVTGKQIGRAHV